MSRSTVIGPLLVGASCIALLTLYTVRQSVGLTTHGFVSYYAAAQAISSGRFGPWVYDDARFAQYVQEVARAPVAEIFTPNTPAAAVIVWPVAWLDASRARTLWLLVSLIALAWMVAALAVDAARARVPALPFWIATALLSPAVFANLRTAQAYLVLAAGLALATTWLTRDRERRSGILLGLLFIMKPTIGPLLVLCACQRRAMVVINAALAALAAALITIPFVTLAAWREWPIAALMFVGRGTTSVTAYQTATGLLRRLCVADAQWNPDPVASCTPLATAGPLVLCLIAFALTAYAARRAPPRLWIGAGVCLSLMALPVAEDHQFVVLVIPIFLLLTETRRMVWPVAGVVALSLVPPEYSWQRFSAGWSMLFAYPRLYSVWLLWGLTIGTMWKDYQSRR